MEYSCLQKVGRSRNKASEKEDASGKRKKRVR